MDYCGVGHRALNTIQLVEGLCFASEFEIRAGEIEVSQIEVRLYCYCLVVSLDGFRPVSVLLELQRKIVVGHPATRILGNRDAIKHDGVSIRLGLQPSYQADYK